MTQHQQTDGAGEPALTLPFVRGRAIAEDAARLIAEFGREADLAAALRATQSRAHDNALRFCHWREVERMVRLLTGDATPATRH